MNARKILEKMVEFDEFDEVQGAKRTYIYREWNPGNLHQFDGADPKEEQVGYVDTVQQKAGWGVYIPSQQAIEWIKEKTGSADMIFRVASDKGMTLARFNPAKGTFAFADNKHMVDTNELAFQKASAYRVLHINPDRAGMFGIVRNPDGYTFTGSVRESLTEQKQGTVQEHLTNMLRVVVEAFKRASGQKFRDEEYTSDGNTVTWSCEAGSAGYAIGLLLGDRSISLTSSSTTGTQDSTRIAANSMVHRDFLDYDQELGLLDDLAQHGVLCHKAIGR